MIKQPETELEQLRRMVSETHENVLMIKQQVETMYGDSEDAGGPGLNGRECNCIVVDEGLKSPECSVCDEVAEEMEDTPEDLTGYYDCPACGHRVLEATFKLIRLDYVCPGCYNRIMSQFIHHPGVKQNDQ